MELVPASDFLAWASTRGIAPDARYSEPRMLVYTPYLPHARFWETPTRAAEVPHFAGLLLDGLGEWKECYLWPRGGRWVGAAPDDTHADRLRAHLLRSVGIAPGSAGAFRCTAAERDAIACVAFAQACFGWHTPDDITIVPDHARLFLHTDHHDVVHAQFAGEAAIAPFVERMAAAGYPLPSDCPDWTFKRPDWME